MGLGWTGPFKVIEMIVLLRSRDSKVLVIQMNDVKPYEGTEQPIFISMELDINKAELYCKSIQKDCQVCGSWFKNCCAIGWRQRHPTAAKVPNASSTPLPSSEEPTCAAYEEDFHTFTLEEVTMGEESDADLDIVVHGYAIGQ